MKRFFSLFSISIVLVLTMSRCELLLAIATAGDDNCERYSIYRSTIFGEDDLLWEETSCDYDSVRLEERFKEKMAYYTALYSGSYVYKEHVTYSQ